MKILALSSWFPYPPHNGARMRVHNLLRQLAQWHEVVLLSFAQEEVMAQEIEAVRAYCKKVTVVPFKPFRPHRLRALVGLFRPQPRVLTDLYSPEMERLLEATLRRETFDLALAFAIGPSAVTALYIRQAKGIPRVLEDLELSIIRDRIANERRRPQRWRLRLTWWKLRNFTARLLQDLEGCTVASERERDLLLSIVPGYCPLLVVPNGVDLERYGDVFGPPEPDTLVFPGALTYKANFDAMIFFLREVFPQLKAQRPAVRLYITGRTDGVPVDRLPVCDGVIFTGYLDDIRPRIAQSQVCVVPMTMGGGTRLKILEAMALGTPVVATSKGAEGLEVTPGQDILIANEPAAFAEAVLSLLSDRELRSRLAENARQLVREKYDWKTIGSTFEAFLREVVAAKRRTSARTGRQG